MNTYPAGVCSHCQGTGSHPCSKCGGRGYIECFKCAGMGRLRVEVGAGGRDVARSTHPAPPAAYRLATDVHCTKCRGTGRLPCLKCEERGTARCAKCGGSGRYTGREQAWQTAPPYAADATADPPMAGSAARVSGTVKWFNAERGYGFLTPDDGRADVHVSIKNVRGRTTLRAGGKVTFVRRDGLKGPWATDVMPIT